MKKIAILAILLMILAACTPGLPSRQANTTTENQTMETPQNETVHTELNTTEHTEEITEVKTDRPKDVPTKEVTEGQLVNFPNLKAVDPDGDKITYTFTSPLNEKGEWQTKDGDAGEHLITITATDGSNTVSQQVLVIVKSKNKAPTIELSDSIEATEGELFELSPTITDPEGDEVTVTYSGWMTSATKQINFDEQGIKKVLITAKDEKSTTTKEVLITVKNTNRAPEIYTIPDQRIKEGQKFMIKPVGKDPDADALTYSFDFPLDEKGNWQTTLGDAGEYDIIVKVTDGELEAQTTFKLTVGEVNKAPTIELNGPVTVVEGQTVVLNPTITDKEGDEIRVSYTGWMNTNTKLTDYDDAGEYTTVIVARDSAGNEARHEVQIIVTDINRAPIFGAGSFN